MTFVEGMLDLVPTARVAHIGLYREPETFAAVEYFFKAPADLAERLVIVVDPMLATANTAVAAVDRLKERGARDIRLVCLLGAPRGLRAAARPHPDVPIWTAAIDERARRARLHRARPRRRRRPRLRHPLMATANAAAAAERDRRPSPLSDLVLGSIIYAGRTARAVERSIATAFVRASASRFGYFTFGRLKSRMRAGPRCHVSVGRE